MAVIEHGDWQLYTPSPFPESMPVGALFARRVSDGADWYDYVKAGSNFQANTIKMTVAQTLVCAATTDPAIVGVENAIADELRRAELAGRLGSQDLRRRHPDLQRRACTAARSVRRNGQAARASCGA